MKKSFGIPHRFFHKFAGLRASLVLLIGLLFVATPSLAAKILNLRAGKNEEYTRIVIELDQPTNFQYAEQSGVAGPELVVTVKASSQAQALDVSTRYVNSIQVKPSGAETRIVVQLPRAGAKVKELILQAPPRIVLDVSAGGKAPAASAPAAVKMPTATAPTKPSTSASSPTVTKTEAPKQESPKSVAPPPSVSVTPLETKPAETKPSVVAEAPEAATSETSVEDSASEEEVEATGAEEAAGEPLEQPAPEKAAKKSAASKPPQTSQPQDLLAQLESQLEGLPALIGSGVLVVLALVAYLLFKKRRKPLASARTKAADEEDSEEEDDSLFGSEPWESDRSAPSKKSEPSPGESLAFEFSASKPAAARQSAASAPQAPVTSQSFVTPPPAPPVDAVKKAEFEVLEARIKGFEDQLTGFTAARERLEAQIKSQAEELRVQRAAIARTQRVVRSLASAEDDMPAEPAPKAPLD